jgi:hypothetical protein
MGQETTCKAVINGERTQGKALPETDVLIFRFYGARKAADLECFASLKDSRAGLQLTPSEICPAQRVKALLKRVQARKGTVAPAAGPWAAARAGLVDVKVVRFSDTHTAEKFVIPIGARG